MLKVLVLLVYSLDVNGSLIPARGSLIRMKSTPHKSTLKQAHPGNGYPYSTIAAYDSERPWGIFRAVSGGRNPIVQRRSPTHPLISVSFAGQPVTQSEAFEIMIEPKLEWYSGPRIPRLAPEISLWNDLEHEILPSWITNDGTSEPDDSIMKAEFGNEIARQGRTAVWAIGSDKVIKYSRFCPFRSEDVETQVDTLLLESYFLGLLNNTGIANKIFYYSQAAMMPIEGDSRTLLPPKIALRRCPDQRPPVVRFMISERILMDMCGYMKGLQSSDRFIASIRVGLATIELLKSLHSREIIHGDIHCGNVAWTLDGSRIVLIDFGRARIINADEDQHHASYQLTSPVEVVNSGFDNFKGQLECHMFDTPWEMMGMKRSFRDDIFRALRLVAEILYGGGTAQYLYRLCESWGDGDQAEFVRLQMVESLFEITSKSSTKKSFVRSLSTALAQESESVRAEIARILNEIVDHVRSLGPMEKPNYDHVITGLTNILSMRRENPQIIIQH
jgi:hypothetical protein